MKTLTAALLLLAACSSGAGSVASDGANSMLVLHPYRAYGQWVFDDARAGLVQEPFVAGAA